MPGINGFSAAEIILERYPEVCILILSIHDSPECVSSALSHGIKGDILNNVATEEVYNAIINFSAGQNYLSTHTRAALSPAKDTDREPLTSREQTILLQLTQDKYN